MKILAIDTSCDETSVAITEERRVLSNVIFSQIQVHQEYGGVYPLLAKREHLTKIDPAIALALKRARLNEKDIDAIAITFGPGLSPALEVGVQKAKGLAQTLNKPLIPVDHIEGHIYSPYVENSKGKPTREFNFPILSLVVSGNHTQLVLFKNHIEYEIIGETLDDAAGEALDKSARLLGLGYPGGPTIERLAQKGDETKYQLPIPMMNNTLDFSYSGLKTAFKRLVYSLTEQEKLNNLSDLSASFQKATFDSLLYKLNKALKTHQVKSITLVGGVAQNRLLRVQTRALAKKYKLPIYFPPYNYLSGDNAAMIGVAAHYKYQKGIFLTDASTLDRVPRAHLDKFI